MKLTRNQLNILTQVFLRNSKAQRILPGQKIQDEHRKETVEITESVVMLLKQWGKIADR